MDGSFLIVSADEIYIQFLSIGEPDDPWVYCEAVSNEFLPPAKQLGADRISALAILGFEDSGDSPNYSCKVSVPDGESRARVAETILYILEAVYLCEPDTIIDIDLHIQ